MHPLPPRRLPPHRTPPIRTAADLHLQWRSLMGHLGFGTRSLWMSFLDEQGRPDPVLPRIEDLPSIPDAASLRNLIEVAGTLLPDIAPSGSVAFLLSRPGGAATTTSDRAWGVGIDRAAARAALPIRPFVIATNEAVVFLDKSLAA